MSQDTPDPRNKAELLERIEADRNALLKRLAALDEARFVAPLARGGWSVKDHVAHIAAWERYLAALLTGANRWTEMGLTGAPDQAEADFINETIYERNKDLSARQVYAAWDAAHRQVLDALAQMSDDDLMRPFSDYVPEAAGEGVSDPVVAWVNGNTWGHYAEHEGWLEVVLGSAEVDLLPGPGDEPQTVEEIRATMEAARAALRSLLAGLDDAALLAPRGPDGWAIKDHLLHLAAWERGVAAMLRRQDRWSAMGLTDAQAEQAGDFNDINALLQEQARARSSGEALAELEAAHGAMIEALATLTDADLQRAYDSFVPAAADPNAGPPIFEIVNGNSWGHYAEHIEWIIDALAEEEANAR
jgi:uncharacterized damage-inducible protein DinB